HAPGLSHLRRCHSQPPCGHRSRVTPSVDVTPGFCYRYAGAPDRATARRSTLRLTNCRLARGLGVPRRDRITVPRPAPSSFAEGASPVPAGRCTELALLLSAARERLSPGQDALDLGEAACGCATPGRCRGL